MDIGENAMEAKTDAEFADSNTITETEHPHHEVAITGMFRFL